MTNEMINVPELRFTGFEDEWKKKKLDDVANYRRGSFPQPYGNKEWYDKKNGEPFVQVVDVDKNMKLHDQTKKKISDLAKPKSVKGFKGDIVVTLQGSIGRVALLHYDAYIDRTLLLIDSFKIEMNKNYFKYVLYLLFLKEKERAPGGTIKTITKKVLSNFKIDIPNVGEQEKIGKFFSKLDRQIELEEQKLVKLEEQKKGYMQKIFSQELRFKDDNGNSYPDWSIKKIEDISKVNKGFTPNTKNDEYWDELNENWLSIAGMTQKYLYKGNKGITEKGASKHVKVDKDTLIMSFKLTLGKLAIVKEPIYTNEAICHFVWKESNVNTEYMYYYLNSINISTFGAQAVKGVTLNNDSINSIIVKLPVIQEQNKIAYFFNELDKLIRKQYAKIELLKQRKNGLLQKMFV